MVDDDVAVEDSLYTQGRRGIAGTVFAHKITGASGSRRHLAEVQAVANKVIANAQHGDGLTPWHFLAGKPTLPG